MDWSGDAGQRQGQPTDGEVSECALEAESLEAPAVVEGLEEPAGAGVLSQAWGVTNPSAPVVAQQGGLWAAGALAQRERPSGRVEVVPSEREARLNAGLGQSLVPSLRHRVAHRQTVAH